MDIFGIGPLELLFILLITFIVLGPTDLVKTGRTIGQFIQKVNRSPTWQLLKSTSRSLRNLPNALAEESGIEAIRKDLLRGAEAINRIGGAVGTHSQTSAAKLDPQGSPDLSAWTTPPLANSSEAQSPAADLDQDENGSGNPSDLPPQQDQRERGSLPDR